MRNRELVLHLELGHPISKLIVHKLTATVGTEALYLGVELPLHEGKEGLDVARGIVFVP
jgi:hypothetical protein